MDNHQQQQAVALAYKSAEFAARVLAKGRGASAKHIIAVAQGGVCSCMSLKN
ncbi:MAG: type III secretion system FlhB-like substrate exporter [Methylophilaceae bacterium]|jgi:type III secretion system FlhB-like substrate exporter